MTQLGELYFRESEYQNDNIFTQLYPVTFFDTKIKIVTWYTYFIYSYI